MPLGSWTLWPKIWKVLWKVTNWEMKLRFSALFPLFLTSPRPFLTSPMGPHCSSFHCPRGAPPRLRETKVTAGWVSWKTVSIKHGLRTADYGLRTEYKIRTRYKTRTGKYGLGIKRGLGIKGGLRTADCALGINYGLRTTLVKTVLIGFG